MMLSQPSTFPSLLLLPALALAVVSVSGCGRGGGGGGPAAHRADAAVRMTAQPVASLPGRRISALLDFDSPDDLTFVTSDPAGGHRQ